MEKYIYKQVAITSCAYLGEIGVGYSGWYSPVVVKLQDPEQTPLSGLILDNQLPWLSSIALPGVLFGIALAGWFSNVFGRKPCLLLGGFFHLICYLLMATAVNFRMLLIGRFSIGTGIGIICAVNFTYIAEIASTHVRGILLTASGFFTSFGILLGFAVAPYTTYMGVMFVGLFLTTSFCIGTLFIPETPTFYFLKGREIEAKTTLVYLGRSDDVEEILTSKPPKAKSAIQGLKEVFLLPTNRKAFVITAVIYFCQGMSGYIPVIIYVTSIFQSVNSSLDPAISTIIVGITQVLSSCITPLFVERKGRKLLLIVSTAGCSLSMAILGTYFLIQSADNAAASQLHWIPLVSVITYLISYQSGFASIPSSCASEMFDSSARGPGSALGLLLANIVSFIMTTVFGYMSSTDGAHFTFLAFAGASALCCIFTSLYAVETKGKSLAEVQLLLNK